MPICKNCGSRLTHFNKDICPVCGCKKPFEGAPTDTLDITQDIKAVDPNEINGYARKKKSHAFLYALFLGFSGAPFYYLNFKKYGIIYSLSLLVLNALLFVGLYLGVSLSWWIALLIVCGVYLIADLILGICLFKPDLKDGRGEYLD